MKKIAIALLCLVCFLDKKSNAQNYMYGIGANISVLTAKINTPYEQYDFAMVMPHFSYTPRFIVSEGKNSSITIGFPLGVGIGILNSGGVSGIAWGVDVPVAFDYNIGNMSTPEINEGFGWYFGAGFGYLYTGYSDGGDVTNIHTYGPLGRLGIRFGSNFHTTVGVFYKTGLESGKYKTFGFNVLMEH
jgi:hypothetical protein